MFICKTVAPKRPSHGSGPRCAKQCTDIKYKDDSWVRTDQGSVWIGIDWPPSPLLQKRASFTPRYIFQATLCFRIGVCQDDGLNHFLPFWQRYNRELKRCQKYLYYNREYITPHPTPLGPHHIHSTPNTPYLNSTHIQKHLGKEWYTMKQYHSFVVKYF